MVVNTINLYAGYQIPDKDLKSEIYFYLIENLNETEKDNNKSDLENAINSIDNIINNNTELKKRYTEHFKELSEKNKEFSFKNIHELRSELRKDDDSNIERSKNNSSNGWLTAFVTLALINLAILVFFFKEKISENKIEKDNDNKVDNYPKESPKPIDLTNHPIIINWQNRCKELENKLVEKEKEIEELKKEIGDQKMVDQDKEKPAPVSVPEASKEIVYYASNIDADGYFDINDLKSSTNNNEFYKINIFNDRAEFEFYNNKNSLQTGLEYINDYIKPFCYEINFQGDNVNSIITVKKGTLLKEGNRWKVQQKAEIRYE